MSSSVELVAYNTEQTDLEDVEIEPKEKVVDAAPMKNGVHSVKENGVKINQFNKDVILGIDDKPPWHLCILMGLQHYFTFLGSVVSLPFLLAPALCIPVDDPARAHLTYTMLFVFGIGTLLQTIFGSRLPIIQGGSFAYLVPAFTILNLPQWRCPDINNADVTNFNTTAVHWHDRMRELQGDVAVVSVIQILLGVTGAVGFLLRWITPLVVAPTITLIGLSLFAQAANLASHSWPISIGAIFLMILFSQYLSKIHIPIPFYNQRLKRVSSISYPIFSVLPILFSISIMWTICYVLTATDVLPENSPARTDRSGHIIENSPWFKFPIPLEFGIPTVSVAGVVGMTAAVVASVVESIGDYYACARLCEIAAPPANVVNRGIAAEGLAGIIAGLWGTGVGATSLSQNIGAIGLTKVASRQVIQTAALMMILFGMFTKFGSIFATIPSPIIGGIYCVMFGLITAVGISNVQFINLNSSRNLLILGFSIFAGLSFPSWINKHPDLHFTGIETLDQVFKVVLSTNMLLGGLLGFVLDNTIPGTDKDRGLVAWRSLHCRPNDDSSSGDLATYNFPYGEKLKSITSSIRQRIPLFRKSP
ncbi:hypothetical protein CHUAL_006791 [Chamberlinius hualienensis]